jgi:hypothetical protein
MRAVLALCKGLVPIAALVAALMGGGLSAGEPNHGPRTRPEGTPVASQRMEQGRFRMKDADFFRDPEAGLAAGVRMLMKEAFKGLALEAPRTLSTSEQSSCPVLLAQIDFARKLMASPLDKYGVLIATDLRRHRTFAAPAVEPRSPSDDDPPLSMPSATQVSARSFRVDLRARLGLPWESGELRVRAVSRDQISNQASILLKAGNKGARAAARKGVGESQAAPPIFPQPGNPLPNYGKAQDSPALPEEPGLRIVVRQTSGSAQRPSLPVYGSFLVPRSAVQIVSAAQRKSYRAPIPYGVATVALVLTGREAPRLEKVELHVPVYPPAKGSRQPDQVAGYFALDLAAHLPILDRAQTWFLYAFCDELSAGPFPVVVDTRGALPAAPR